MADRRFRRSRLLVGCSSARDNRLEHIQQRLQFRLRLPLQHRDYLVSGSSRLAEHRTQCARQLIRQLQGHPSDLAIHGHHRQAAEPFHRYTAGRILDRKALQQFAALWCMDEQAQGAVLGPLAGGGGAGIDHRSRCK
ncbi:hypothetical protein KBZ14_15530 [Synechococcus sp. HJ21-Hayes]|uniref:hypothetical protein n=1 Tax=unclassified Synechococcus TaxID=2626047 RepID=UPI0020CBC1FC|nr:MULTISPECIES: hypothetical protein [unclassified Synechococcus]MCP9832699.1 hypothetical protein [Synechococcus sp. JJ3a-Johnson]MCP9854267.1 hypothetical protein [Synechococcus sp. HJ21-Hayes]